MRIWCLAILAALPSLPSARTESGGSPQVFFAPTGDKRVIEDRIGKEISAARREIVVAMYQFTSDRLAQALANAHRRGIRVRVLLDGRQAASARGGYARARNTLERAGVPLRYVYPDGAENRNRKGSRGNLPKMHHKFCVIDRERLITGSFNWTVLADEKNHENVLLLSSRPLAGRYQDRFDELWNDRRISVERES